MISSSKLLVRILSIENSKSILFTTNPTATISRILRLAFTIRAKPIQFITRLSDLKAI